MPTVKRALESAVYWGFVSVSSLTLFPVASGIYLVTAPFDPRRALLHRFTSVWAGLYSWGNPRWTISVEGQDQIRDDEPAVLVANHRSLVDIFVLYRLFRHFKWVAKAELFRVPLIGWNMALNGYVPLKRGDASSVQAMFERCHQALRSGSSVLIFPEGTRSRSERLRPFKVGAFELAQQAGVPIIPIAIEGTQDALEREWLVHDASMRISVLEPIRPESWSGVTAEELAQQVHNRIQSFLHERATSASDASS